MQPLILRLMNEHRLIEGALDALNACALGAEPARADLRLFTGFFRDYADGVHHAKEENALFAALEAAGMRRDMGPLAVMLYEHEQGRAAIRELASIAGADGGGVGGTELLKLRVLAQRYSDLLRGHIMKEDRVLYPMAMQGLDDAIFLRLDEQVRESEARYAPDLIGGLEAGARELIARFPADCAPLVDSACNSLCAPAKA